LSRLLLDGLDGILPDGRLANAWNGCVVDTNAKAQGHGRRTIQKSQLGSWLCCFVLSAVGRGGGIRTRDPLHPMQVRYQAALRPDKLRIIDPNPAFAKP
jgi:hypothetical protein